MAYMRAHLGLLKALVQSLGMSTEDVTARDMEDITEFAFERYVRTASLIGTPTQSLEVVNQLREIGVDEVGCLIDWMDGTSALEGLGALQQLRQLAWTSAPGAREFRAYCAGSLPDYMVPTAFVTLDEFPLTPNGKLDARALPAPGLTAFAMKRYEAPQGEIEETLAGIWSELLQVEQVGRHDNFFELGGHSILAIRVIARVQDQLTVHLPVKAIFEFQTVERLAEYAQAILAIRRNAPAVSPDAQETRMRGVV
jgi:acyl carrier protein